MLTRKSLVKNTPSSSFKIPCVRDVILGGVVAAGVSLCLFRQAPIPAFIPMKSYGHIVNVAYKNINWIEQDGDCFYACTKKTGCVLDSKFVHDKWVVCKSELPKSYDTLRRAVD